MTICTKNRELLFDNSEIKSVARDCWLAIPDHYPHAAIDKFIVMPNHMHGIIFINNDGKGTACRALTFEQFGKPVSGSLPTIIRSFRSAATKQINILKNTPGSPVWQRNYYEHIIRNETDLNNIRQYIIDNPINWEEDENNPKILQEAPEK